MATRLKDIAEHLQLSTMTVSKVLRNHPDISEKTRARVMKHVREIDYRPNFAARSLVTGRTYAIGLIVPDLVHPFFGEVAKAFSRVLRSTGYSLVLSSSEGDAALERQEIDLLLSRQVDVLVLASSQTSAASLRVFEKRKTPYILIDRSITGLDCNFVGSDDLEAGRIAAEHLLETGCTRIAHIGGPEISTALNRAEGFKQSLHASGFPLPIQYLITRKHDSDAGDVTGYKAMQRLLALRPRPDGVFCYNDPTAMGAMRAALEAGLQVPEDIAIMGCGNVTYAGFMRVPLTSVDQQSQLIGETSARLALDLLEKNPRHPKRAVLRPTLVKRESTNRLKNTGL
jgi:LacI family transcriptional regulator